MSENPMIWVFLLTLCELFESWWQHAPTMGGILEKVERHYRRNIFLLFAMHPSLWLVLFVYTLHGFHGIAMGIIITMKATDIAFKIHLLRLKETRRLSDEMFAMLTMPLQPWLPWINVFIYPGLMAVAMGSG